MRRALTLFLLLTFAGAAPEATPAPATSPVGPAASTSAVGPAASTSLVGPVAASLPVGLVARDLPVASAVVPEGRMVFDAGPEPVARGGTVTLSGRSWRGPTGNQGRIDFTFQRYGTLGFVLAAYTTADDSGRFRMRVPARATGTWKATRAGTGSARRDAVQVVERQARQIVSYSGELTAWQGPRLRIPSAGYRAVVSYRCAADGYFWLHWNGDSGGFEYAGSTKPAGTITLAGHSGARSGYFEVSTWVDCVWSVRVFSGSVLVQV